MAEPYEYLHDQMRLANEGRISGQQAYSELINNYGFISIDSFVDVLVDSYGYANLLACRIAQWILDWYRLTADGRPRFSGTLFLPSRQLAQELNVSEKSFKLARGVIRDAGIAKFITRGHRCEVAIDWVAVLEAVDDRSTRMSDGTNRDSLDMSDGTNRDSLDMSDGTNRDSLDMSDGTNRDSLDMSDGTNRDSLRGLDGTNRYHIPTLRSSLKSSSLEGGQEEDVEKSGEGDARRPSAGVDESPGGQWGDTELRAMANELIEYGIKHGRPCSGPWAKQSQEAFTDVVRDGHDPAIVGAAWRAYLATFGDAKRASDLGHWLRSVDLKDRPFDYADRGFDAVYTAQAVKAVELAELERIKNGGMPDPKFNRAGSGGTRSWYVSWPGHVTLEPFDVVAPDAAMDECVDAWPGWWESWKKQHP